LGGEKDIAYANVRFSTFSAFMNEK
jgi:hypothetical protein